MLILFSLQSMYKNNNVILNAIVHLNIHETRILVQIGVRRVKI